MKKKIFSLILLLTIVITILIAGCAKKAPVQQTVAESQEEVTQTINQVDDLTQNLEDEELDSELTDAGIDLENW